MTAVKSFGKTDITACGEAPSGYTRLTSEVLEWVKTTVGMVQMNVTTEKTTNI